MGRSGLGCEKHGQVAPKTSSLERNQLPPNLVNTCHESAPIRHSICHPPLFAGRRTRGIRPGYGAAESPFRTREPLQRTRAQGRRPHKFQSWFQSGLRLGGPNTQTLPSGSFPGIRYRSYRRPLEGIPGSKIIQPTCTAIQPPAANLLPHPSRTRSVPPSATPPTATPSRPPSPSKPSPPPCVISVTAHAPAPVTPRPLRAKLNSMDLHPFPAGPDATVSRAPPTTATTIASARPTTIAAAASK